MKLFKNTQLNIFPDSMIKRLILVAVTMLVSTFLFELLKNTVYPDSTIWISHFITIVFAATTATSVAYLFFRRQDELHQGIVNENTEKKVALIRLEASIQEKTLAEQKATESEKRFKDLVENLSDWIWEINADGVYTYSSGLSHSILGYPNNEILGKTPFDFMAPDEALRVGELFKPIFDERRAFQDLENCCLTQEGRTICLLTSGVPIFSEHGVFLGYRGVDKDISELKQKDAERELLESQLRQSQKLEAIGTMAGGIAHDFNNLLQAQYFYISILQKQLPPQDQYGQTIQHIIDTGERARDLVKRILTFSRHGEAELKPLAVQDILKDSLELLRSALPSSISITENVDMDTDPVLADQAQVQQIILNLCNNAHQAMGTSSGVLAISLAQRRRDELAHTFTGNSEAQQFAELIISDTGVGMDQLTQEMIFDPFYTTRDIGEGTGLGLAVVHGIVKDMQGEIFVRSQPGQGSTFTILFPTTEDNPTQPQFQQRSTTQMFDQTILLVDDELAILQAGKPVLESYGFTVITATTGQEGLSKLEEVSGHIDIIITDLTMPKMSGLEFAEKVHDLYPHLPIILTTGNLQNDGLSNFEESGIRSILKKPWTQVELLTTLIDLELDTSTPLTLPVND